MKAALVAGVLFAWALIVCAAQQQFVQIDWQRITLTSKTNPTLQVVVNPMIRRGSPIHDAVFSSLKALKANHVRFVPWLPYPKLAVAELEPPTGNPRCATILNLDTLYMDCGLGGTFTSIDFAAYGTPSGSCGKFRRGSCNAANATQIVEKFCLGKSSCTVPVQTAIFGDPCYGTVKHLVVQATCTPAINSTSWNFTLIDPLMEDFMAATRGHTVIINFSTIPQWMFDTPAPVPYPSDPNQVDWSYEQGTELRDPSMKELGDYYARLVSWYTKGGFVDEYGQRHQSHHRYHIPFWEVLNEVDYEHSMTPQQYTRRYDAIVSAIRKVSPRMQFVGMALAAHPEYNWFEYFLNSSNHLPGIPLDWISYHFYASPSTRNSPTAYLQFFPQADGFLAEVQHKQEIRQALSPATKTTIDEVGVILPNDNVDDPPPIPDIYWNAAGAMYAYLYSNLAKLGIEVVGESQLVGYPTQFPSVTMIDWVGGKPNSRYWILKMLLENSGEGDSFVATNSSTSDVYAQGYQRPSGEKKILLVNKSLQVQSVSLPQVAGSSIEFVDLTTNYNPPGQAKLTSNVVTLNAFAVAIVTLPH